MTGIKTLVLMLLVCGLTVQVFAQVDPLAPEPVYTPPTNIDCLYCDAVFSSQSALDEHIALEHTFICPYCGDVFRSNSALESHIETMHSLPDGMEFVTIPSGSFMMGSPSSEDGRSGTEDQHWVSVNSFEMMTTEVTQSMWEYVMSTTVDEMRSLSNNDYGLFGIGDDYPMYYVSWDDCQKFIDELNDMDPNHTYRFPSEAEWEYACRAGSTTRFYWGNSDLESTVGRYCWYKENSNDQTHPVGAKRPNSWGLYDMSGNVGEHCQDESFAGSVSQHSIRGGYWGNCPLYCRSARNHHFIPSARYRSTGFRLARSVL